MPPIEYTPVFHTAVCSPLPVGVALEIDPDRGWAMWDAVKRELDRVSPESIAAADEMSTYAMGHMAELKKADPVPLVELAARAGVA